MVRSRCRTRCEKTNVFIIHVSTSDLCIWNPIRRNPKRSVTNTVPTSQPSFITLVYTVRTMICYHIPFRVSIHTFFPFNRVVNKTQKQRTIVIQPKSYHTQYLCKQPRSRSRDITGIHDVFNFQIQVDFMKKKSK